MWRDDARLLDMLLAAKELSGYTKGVTLEEFDRDRLLQHAAMRFAIFPVLGSPEGE